MGDRRTVAPVRRSANASMRTPQQRASYSARISRSPGNRTPLTVAGLTSNSEHNRRQANENAAKVIEQLQSHRTFFNRLNLSNGNIKSMTSNQFIEIISFFMMKIAGKNFLSKSRPNNHDEVILTFIQQLKYPYAVNRACFKSPNSHQYFPEVIAILAFLSDIMCDMNKCIASMGMPLKCCDRLLNEEFTQLFSTEALTNYLSYDPDNDSFVDDESEARMIDRFIAIKMKNNRATAAELAAKVVELQQSNEQLQQNLIESATQKCYADIQEQMLDRENKLQTLQIILSDKRTHLKMIMLKHGEQAAILRAKQANCADLVEKIDKQKYTTVDVKQLMAKEISLKGSITMIQNETEVIKAEAADAQVKLARLQKLKFDAIKRFNDWTYHIAQKLMEVATFRQLNINDLTIDPAASANAIQKVCINLNILNEKCTASKRQYTQDIEQIHDKMMACRAELEQLNEKYAIDTATFQTASKKLDDLNQEYTNLKCDRTTNAIRMQCAIDEQIIYKKQWTEQINDFKMKITHLQTENMELMNVGEKNSLEIIRTKRAAIKQMDQLNDFIDSFFGEDDGNGCGTSAPN